MFKGIVFVCLLASLSWCAEDAVDSTFEITPVGNLSELDCGKHKDKNNPVNLTILQGQSLKLKATTDKNFAFFYKCQKLHHTEDIVKIDNLIRKEIKVKVNEYMGGIWNCSVLTNENNDQIKPVFYYNKIPYSIAYCYLQVHVRRATTPQTILVNNMILPTARLSDKDSNYDHNAVYYYSEGDYVIVSCIITNNQLTVNNSLNFNYDYTETYKYKNSKESLNKYNLPKTLTDKPKTIGFGFRTTLGSEHDKSVMTCKCYDDDDYTTVKVTFEKRQPRDEGLLAVNGHIARNYENMQDIGGIPIFNYMFFETQTVTLNCSSGYQSFFDVSPCKDFIQKEPNIDCYECDGQKYGFKRTTMGNEFNESKALTINLPEDNILLELYDNKDEAWADHFSWTYYNYNEYDILPLTVSKPVKPPMKITCKFHDLNDTSNKEVFLNITLTSKHDKSVLSCTLEEEKPKSETVFTLYVQFLMNAATTTSTTTVNANIGTLETTTSKTDESGKGEPSLNWMIPVVAVLMIIVIIIVFIVIYRMRKRNQMKETDRNEILQNSNEASIPPYPPQCTATEEQNYHVPVDLRQDNNVYAVPINAKETPYAVPIAKSKRKGKENNELVYAELNLKGPKASNSKTNEPTYSSNEPTYAELNVPIGKNRHNEEPAYATVTDLYSHVVPKDKKKNQGNTELYTQVLPKSARTNHKNEYGNVFPGSPYVNSSGAEYVEPTYVEARRK